MNLFIGCSSSEDINEKYILECEKYLDELFKCKNNLVFGAYNGGIMGISYNSALKNKRDIIGICPDVFKSELNNLECTKSIVTEDILERTKNLINEADALIFLPGGIGTILELIAAIDKKRNGEIDKPIIIYNCYNFFDDLFLFLEKIYKEKFSNENIRKCYYFSNSSKDTLEYIVDYYKEK